MTAEQILALLAIAETQEELEDCVSKAQVYFLVRPGLMISLFKDEKEML